jgi:type I restriction enzyme S subunit
MSTTGTSNGWSEFPLGEVCEPTELTNPEKQPETPFLYVDVSSVSNETFSITEPRQILGKDAPSRARKVIRRDDVIFATVRPSLQRIALVPSTLDGQVCSTGFCVLRPKSATIDPKFLYFWLLTEGIRHTVEGLQDGATYPAIRDSDLFEQRIPVPTVPEQKAVARALDAVQKAKEARQRELTLERERKAALMEHLFTYGTSGEPTKQTEIGEIPESWQVLCLGDVATIERGKFAHRPRNAPEFYGGSVPFIQTGDVANSNGHIRTYSQTLNERGLSISRIFPKGTIVITIAANIGFTAILDFDSAFPDSLIGITPGEGVLTEYLNCYLVTQQPEMDRKAPRGTQKNINIEFLRPWPVVVPSTQEQGIIAEVLRGCDSRIELLREETRLLDELFRAILEELMTGRLSAEPPIEEQQAQ